MMNFVNLCYRNLVKYIYTKKYVSLLQFTKSVQLKIIKYYKYYRKGERVLISTLEQDSQAATEAPTRGVL